MLAEAVFSPFHSTYPAREKNISSTGFEVQQPNLPLFRIEIWHQCAYYGKKVIRKSTRCPKILFFEISVVHKEDLRSLKEFFSILSPTQMKYSERLSLIIADVEEQKKVISSLLQPKAPEAIHMVYHILTLHEKVDSSF